MPEFTKRPQTNWFRPGVLLGVAGLALFCVVYGATFALLAPYLMLPLLTPLVIALALAIWVLPESRTAPIGAITTLLFAYLLGLALWPNYLAVSLPGTPWITVSRLTGAPLFLLLLYAFSTSSQIRQTIRQSAAASRFVFIAYLVFLGTQFVSIFLSKHTSETIEKFVNAQFSWTGILIVSMIVFHNPQNSRRLAKLLWLSAWVLASIGLFEWRQQHLPWANHIPGFLKINDDSLATYLRGSQRAYTTVYRSQSTSSTSIGFAEFLALAAPFVFYFTSESEKIWVRVSAAASIFVIFAGIFVSDSRSGMIGFAITFLSFILAMGIRAWRKHRNSFIGIATSLSYPMMLVMAFVASFTVHTIRVKIWGGGAQQASTEARVTQMHMGLPLVVKNPLGYGMGQGAGILGYRVPSGQLTIDSYYLSLALDFGVIGFAAFMIMVGAAIFLSMRMELRAVPSSTVDRMYLPIFQTLTAFVVIKSVFSQQDNHPIIFMVIGLLLALAARDCRLKSPLVSTLTGARNSAAGHGAA
jgi:hypothetical protein